MQALLQNVIQFHLNGDSDVGVDEKSDCSAESDVDGVDILSGESDLRYLDVEIKDFGIAPSGWLTLVNVKQTASKMKQISAPVVSQKVKENIQITSDDDSDEGEPSFMSISSVILTLRG